MLRILQQYQFPLFEPEPDYIISFIRKRKIFIEIHSTTLNDLLNFTRLAGNHLRRISDFDQRHSPFQFSPDSLSSFLLILQ